MIGNQSVGKDCFRSVIASEEEAGGEGLLAEGFSGAAFTVCESNDIDLRILVQPRPERQQPIDTPAPSVLYEARVRKLAGGDIQLIKSESRQEMAPVVSGSSGRIMSNSNSTSADQISTGVLEQTWENYWFRPASSRSLAVVRIVTGILGLLFITYGTDLSDPLVLRAGCLLIP